MICGILGTIPEREDILETVIKNIYHQVDVLYVSLNKYTSVPVFFKDYSNVIVNLNYNNDLRDCERFLFLKDIGANDFIVSFDDDIIYPKNYVKRMKSASLLHKHAAIITVLGYSYRVDRTGKISNFRKHKRPCFRFQKGCPKLIKVDFCGSGTLFFRRKLIDIDKLVFLPGNSDLMISYYCKQNKISIFSINRDMSWLVPIMGNDHTDIYTERVNDMERQTQLINDMFFNERDNE